MRRSAVIVWREALRDGDVSSRGKVVGLVLATYFNRDCVGFAYPSLATLAQGASVSERTAGKAIDDLHAAGFVDVSRSIGRSSHRASPLLAPS